MLLSESQIERYSRQIVLAEVGGQGQGRLLAAKVLIVGMGGLGSPAGLYLAAAGVGTIGIVDADAVELSNLQRQIAHATPDLGRPKVESAAEKLRAINPDVTVSTHRARLTASNAAELLAPYDFVIDATDTFASKFLLADACHFAGKPYATAGIVRFEGQVMTVLPGQTACYRCVFGAPPAEAPEDVGPCAVAGVLGVVAGVMGTLQAAEAIKFALGCGELLTGGILVYDALRGSFRNVAVGRNPHCLLCGEAPTVTSLRDEPSNAPRPNR